MTGQLGHRGVQNGVSFLVWVMCWVEVLMQRQGALERVQEEAGPLGMLSSGPWGALSGDAWGLGRELGSSDVVGHRQPTEGAVRRGEGLGMPSGMPT